MAFVEGPPDPVGQGVGALALVVDDLLRNDGLRVGVVQGQRQWGGPGEQEYRTRGRQAPGTDPAQPPRGGGTARPLRCAEELAPQTFQCVADPGRLSVRGYAHRPLPVASGEPAALQEEPEQRALHEAEKQGHDSRADGEQRAGRGDTEERVGAPGGVLGHVDHRDDRQAEAAGDGALAGLGGSEGGIAAAARSPLEAPPVRLPLTPGKPPEPGSLALRGC